ncbi:MAG TPA: hypothetical protein VGK41_01360 [Solirubrobacterales bacterium]
MKNQKTRTNRRLHPLPHMQRMSVQAELLQSPASMRTLKVLAYMDEFDVCYETALRMLRNDPRRGP